MTRAFRRSTAWISRAVAWTAVGGLLALGSPATPASAQTDYYNTDAGRPVLIEDAYPTERYAFELQLAPLRLERLSEGVYNWGVEPEIAYGILPRTQVEVGLPLAWIDAPGELGGFGLAGIDASVLHNLNVETSGLPAFGVAAEAVFPVGEFAPEDPYLSLKGIATRTFTWARFHANARWTFGPELETEIDPGGINIENEAVEEPTRWMAGLAVDRVLPLRSMLLIADVYAEQPIREEEEVEWNTSAGIRYQYSPRLALDAGIGRQLTGDEAWFVTFGTAYAFAVRSLIPVPGW
jgi:hypothetical protein